MNEPTQPQANKQNTNAANPAPPSAPVQGAAAPPAAPPQATPWNPSLPDHNVNSAAPAQPAAQPQPQAAPPQAQQVQGQQQQQTPQAQPDANKKPSKFKALFPVFKKVAIVVIVVAAVYGAISFGWHAYHYVETDDAQVAGHSAVLSARVGGTVTQVLVDENWNVKQGQLLATLDQRDYQHALDQAAGDLQSIFSRQKEAETNFKRAKALIKSDSITKQEYDDNQTQYLDYTKKLASQVALVEQAKTNLAYTEVRAPTDGKIGKKSIEPGIVIAPGQSLFTFVETTERWVEANYKETQLRHMRIGQKADIDIDAVSDHTFTGHVDSFSPGSGSSFALIPPDNATGNFTKIVQRVPVKIVFDKDSIAGYEDRVVPGESAVINVRIR